MSENPSAPSAGTVEAVRPAQRRTPAGAEPWRLPAGARLGDDRGLTAAGAITVALGAGVLGAMVDVATGSGLRTVFSILFTLGCTVSAYKVHREDLAAAVVIPPLAYLTLTFVAGLGRASGVGGNVLAQQVLELFTALVLSAPALLLASASAGTVAGLRWLALRTAALDAASGHPVSPQA